MSVVTGAKTTSSGRPVALVKATVAVLVWGASFIATKVAVSETAPIVVVWLRFGMGIVVLAVFVAARGQFARVNRGQLAYFALLGFLGITFHQWLQSTGLVTAQASTTAWIVATTPIFIVLLGAVVLRERLTVRIGVGILLAAAGVVLVVSEGNFATLLSGRFGNAGDRLIFISAINWALFSVLSRRGLARHAAALMMLYVMAWGWVFVSILYVARSPTIGPSSLTVSGWTAVAFLGIFCSGIAYIFWYDALQELPAGQVGAFLYLEPLVAVIVAALVLGEAIYIAAAIGGGFILAGVWLASARTGHRPTKTRNTPTEGQP
jgi:drug/metabolite transporter (DMT)-like permease